MSLFARLVLANAALVAVGMLALVLSPLTVAYPVREIEAFLLIAAMLALIAANWTLTRRLTRPLRSLSQTMASIDAADDPVRLPEPEGDDEVAVMTSTFNSMMDRIEAERAAATSLAVQAQEQERIRVARELHDEVGQTLTALLLQLSAVSRRLPPEPAAELHHLSEAVRAALDEVRGISARLRPGLLDELGLKAALADLGRRVGSPGSIQVTVDAEGDEFALPPEAELVVFRVVQEALTNVVRHAQAETVAVSMAGDDAAVTVTVSDDGNGRLGVGGHGQAGMRERARLVNGRLEINATPNVGTTVRLTIPRLLDRKTSSGQVSSTQIPDRQDVE